MQRRNFLRLGIVTAVSLVVIPQLSATNFRETRPDSWSENNVEDAIKALYGDISPIKGDIVITTPSIASNAKTIPVNISSNIQAKSVALFQDSNPEATIAVFTINENTIIDYDIKIKMAKNGTITAIVEGQDGKYYIERRSLEVGAEGCEGS